MRGEPRTLVLCRETFPFVDNRRMTLAFPLHASSNVCIVVSCRVVSCRPRNIAYRLTFSVFYLYRANVIVPPTIAARRRPRISSRAARKRAGMSNSVGGRGFLAVPSRGHARLNHEITVIPLPLPLPLPIFLPPCFPRLSSHFPD